TKMFKRILVALPIYAAGYMDLGVTGASVILPQQASQYSRKLQISAQETASQLGIALNTEVAEEEEVQAIVECVQRTRSDTGDTVLHGNPGNERNHRNSSQRSNLLV